MTAKDLYVTFIKLGETKENAYHETFAQGIFSLKELKELKRDYLSDIESLKVS